MMEKRADDSQVAEANSLFLNRPNVAGVARDRSGGIAVLIETDDAEVTRSVKAWAKDKPFAVTVRTVGRIVIGAEIEGVVL